MSTTAYPPNGAPGRQAGVNLRRSVNDEIARVAAGLDGSGGSIFEFFCECGDFTCRGFVRMTLADYRLTRPGSVVAH